MSEDYFDSFISGASSGCIVIIFTSVFFWVISVSRIRFNVLPTNAPVRQTEEEE
jgi:5-bromo-4-chloroindolyl phosphate hydrolysis protein